MHCEVWVIPGKQNGIRWMGSVVPHFLPTQRWARNEGPSAVREWGRCLRKVLCLCGHVVGKGGWIVVYYQFVRYCFSISFTIWAVLVQSALIGPDCSWQRRKDMGIGTKAILFVRLGLGCAADVTRLSLSRTVIETWKLKWGEMVTGQNYSFLCVSSFLFHISTSR